MINTKEAQAHQWIDYNDSYSSEQKQRLKEIVSTKLLAAELNEEAAKAREEFRKNNLENKNGY